MNEKSDLLTPYQWKNRILVIFSKDKENNLYQKQTQIFLDHEKGLKERDLIIFQVFKEENIEKGIIPHQKSISSFDIEQLKNDLIFRIKKIKQKLILLSFWWEKTEQQS